jgi:hypothetical protein
MKIFYWDDFLPNWSSGIAVVIAENLKHAREILWEACCDDAMDYDYVKKEIYNKKPIEFSMQKKAFYCHGGS